MRNRTRHHLTIALLLSLLLASAPVSAQQAKQGWVQRTYSRVVKVFKPSARGNGSARRVKPAGDVSVVLPQKHVARDDAVTFVVGRIKKEVPQYKLDNHATRVRHRKISVAFRKGGHKLSGIDLGQVVPSDASGSIPALKALLTQLQAKSASVWMHELASRYHKLKATGKPEDLQLAKGVASVYRHIEKLGGGDRIDTGKLNEAFLNRIGAGLVRRYERRSSARLLPAELPKLPKSTDADVAGLIKQAKTRGNVQRQVSYLERQAAHLRGSKDSTQRLLSHRLLAYLKEYKQPWAGAFVKDAMKRFRSSENPVSWDLTSGVTYTGAVRTSDKTALHDTMADAWRIIRGVVHPDILRKLPPVKVLVEHDRTRAAHSGNTIKIGPKSTLRSVLHEFGHHIEDHAGVKPFAAAQSVRQQRSNSDSVKPLRELIRNSSYKTEEQGYGGGFVAGYMGRRYSHGSTEIISMGLESFQSPAKALEMFQKDGDLMLKLLDAVQHRP